MIVCMIFFNMIHRHDITEILLKVVLNTIKPTKPIWITLKNPIFHETLLAFKIVIRHYISIIE